MKSNGQMDVGMSSIQTFKAHKQEGTQYSVHSSHTYHANTHWCCTVVDHNLFGLVGLVTFSLKR